MAGPVMGVSPASSRVPLPAMAQPHSLAPRVLQNVLRDSISGRQVQETARKIDQDTPPAMPARMLTLHKTRQENILVSPLESKC